MATYRVVRYGGETNDLYPVGVEFEWDGETLVHGCYVAGGPKGYLTLPEEVALVETVEAKPLVEVIKEEVITEKVVAINLHLDQEAVENLFADLLDAESYHGLTTTGEEVIETLREALNA